MQRDMPAHGAALVCLSVLVLLRSQQQRILLYDAAMGETVCYKARERTLYQAARLPNDASGGRVFVARGTMPTRMRAGMRGTSVDFCPAGVASGPVISGFRQF